MLYIYTLHIQYTIHSIYLSWLILMHTNYPCYYWCPCIYLVYIFYFLKSYSTCASHRWFNPSYNPDNHFQNIFIIIVVMCFNLKIVLLIWNFAIYYSNLKQIFFLHYFVLVDIFRFSLIINRVLRLWKEVEMQV